MRGWAALAGRAVIVSDVRRHWFPCAAISVLSRLSGQPAVRGGVPPDRAPRLHAGRAEQAGPRGGAGSMEAHASLPLPAGPGGIRGGRLAPRRPAAGTRPHGRTRRAPPARRPAASRARRWSRPSGTLKPGTWLSWRTRAAICRSTASDDVHDHVGLVDAPVPELADLVRLEPVPCRRARGSGGGRARTGTPRRSSRCPPCDGRGAGSPSCGTGRGRTRCAGGSGGWRARRPRGTPGCPPARRRDSPA